MDKELFDRVAIKCPYPIAAEVRRLLTSDYKKPNAERMRQILKTAEKIIHFLCLLVLSDCIETYMKKTNFTIDDTYKKEFVERFIRPTFGKWIALMRDSIKMVKKNEHNLFIKELNDFFIKGRRRESTSQKAFNELSRIRNMIAHPEGNFAPEDFEELTPLAENHLEIILRELEFFEKYRFRFIREISVKFHRWHRPYFTNECDEVIGHDNKFTASDINTFKLYNTPSVVITRTSDEKCLCLEPLFIYPIKRMKDIFLFYGWNRDKKKINYSPCNTRYGLNLLDTSLFEVYSKNLLKFFEVFAPLEEYEKRKHELEVMRRLKQEMEN